MHRFARFVFASRMLLAVLLLSLAVIGGCGEDDEPNQPAYFGLRITNLTANEYNVFQKPSDAGEAFAKVGVSVSGATYRISPLTPGTVYTFRLVREGAGVDAFDYEKTVQSSSGDVIWEVK